MKRNTGAIRWAILGLGEQYVAIHANFGRLEMVRKQDKMSKTSKIQYAYSTESSVVIVFALETHTLTLACGSLIVCSPPRSLKQNWHGLAA